MTDSKFAAVHEYLKEQGRENRHHVFLDFPDPQTGGPKRIKMGHRDCPCDECVQYRYKIRGELRLEQIIGDPDNIETHTYVNITRSKKERENLCRRLGGKENHWTIPMEEGDEVYATIHHDIDQYASAEKMVSTSNPTKEGFERLFGAAKYNVSKRPDDRRRESGNLGKTDEEQVDDGKISVATFAYYFGDRENRIKFGEIVRGVVQEMGYPQPDRDTVQEVVDEVNMIVRGSVLAEGMPEQRGKIYRRVDPEKIAWPMPEESEEPEPEPARAPEIVTVEVGSPIKRSAYPTVEEMRAMGYDESKIRITMSMRQTRNLSHYD